MHSSGERSRGSAFCAILTPATLSMQEGGKERLCCFEHSHSLVEPLWGSLACDPGKGKLNLPNF